jgi:hypothetical protein
VGAEQVRDLIQGRATWRRRARPWMAHNPSRLELIWL